MVRDSSNQHQQYNQTRRSRVLHRNGGLNLGKPRVCSCFAHSSPRRDLVGRLAFNPAEELRSIKTHESDINAKVTCMIPHDGEMHANDERGKGNRRVDNMN